MGTGYTSVFTSQKKIYPALHLRLMYFSLGSYTPVKFLLKFVILRQFVILLVNTNLVSARMLLMGGLWDHNQEHDLPLCDPLCTASLAWSAFCCDSCRTRASRPSIWPYQLSCLFLSSSDHWSNILSDHLSEFILGRVRMHQSPDAAFY